jgi:hypothetical protein
MLSCIRPAGGPANTREEPATRPEPIQEPSGVPQDESFDPLTLNDDEIEFAAFRVPVDTVSEDSTVGVEGPRQVSGYRVQIFAAADELAARVLEDEARFQFDVPVYLSYDPPNYKIRLGNYTDKNSADDLRKEARRKGYRDAWVVPDLVWIGLPVVPDSTEISPDSLIFPEMLEEEPQEKTP